MKTTIETAQESGFWQEYVHTWMCTTKDIERFAALIRADERERCEKECEDFADGNRWCSWARVS